MLLEQNENLEKKVEELESEITELNTELSEARDNIQPIASPTLAVEGEDVSVSYQ